MKKIEENLKRMALRLRIARALRGSAIGALLGAAVATVLALLDQTGLQYTSWQALGLCFGVSAALGAVIGFALPISKLALADSLDRRLGLRNRLRTALESDGSGEFDRAVVEDAERNLNDQRNRNAFPLRLSRWHAAAVLAMAVASGIFLLGSSPIFLSESEREERESMKAAAEQIRRVANPLLSPREETSLSEERELAERLQKLADDLERGRMSKQEALAKANELSEKADQLAKQRNSEAQRSLTVAEALRKQAEERRLEDAGFGEADMDQVNQSHEELEQQAQGLQKTIEDLENRLGDPELSAAERASLESQLGEAKENLQQIELSQKAKEFLEKLQSHPAYKELMEMAQEMQKSTEAGESQQLTEEQIAEMMKRLEELADQYKTDEDIQRLIEEMKKAAEQCEAAGIGAGVCAGMMGLLPGQGGRSQDNFFANTGQVNKNTEEQDIKATTEERGVRGERGESGEETHIEVMGPTKPGDRTKTPYTQILPKYKKSAESAINRQQIPKSQQKRVREYFESLSGGK